MMALILLICGLCVIIAKNNIVETDELNEIRSINNVEIEVSALVEHTKYDHYIINSLKRRIITLTDMNVIVDDRPTMLVNLLRELHEEYDTSEFLDENPIIHEIIFNYS